MRQVVVTVGWGGASWVRSRLESSANFEPGAAPRILLALRGATRCSRCVCDGCGSRSGGLDAHAEPDGRQRLTGASDDRYEYRSYLSFLDNIRVSSTAENAALRPVVVCLRARFAFTHSARRCRPSRDPRPSPPGAAASRSTVASSRVEKGESRGRLEHSRNDPSGGAGHLPADPVLDRHRQHRLRAPVVAAQRGRPRPCASASGIVPAPREGAGERGAADGAQSGRRRRPAGSSPTCWRATRATRSSICPT